MKTLIARWVAAFLALVAPSAAFGLDESAPVPKPELQVDDVWTYRDVNYWTGVVTGTAQRTISLATGDVVLERVKIGASSSERDEHWTSEWNAVSVGGGRNFSPHWSVFRFPLLVSAKHQAAFEMTSRQGYWKYQAEMTVVGWEDVEVPAGKFRALKVEQNGTYQRQDVNYNGRFKRTFWYVPHVKRWVKFLYEDTTGRGAAYAKNGAELVEFKVK
jgi:hypothetical protein